MRMFLKFLFCFFNFIFCCKFVFLYFLSFFEFNLYFFVFYHTSYGF